MAKQMIAQTPLGRVGEPDDIAAVAVFLASPDSRWITGETIRVAGGLV
jgi:3-oxoacyl-[acyl-carrier protein] reductase